MPEATRLKQGCSIQNCSTQTQVESEHLKVLIWREPGISAHTFGLVEARLTAKPQSLLLITELGIKQLGDWTFSSARRIKTAAAWPGCSGTPETRSRIGGALSGARA